MPCIAPQADVVRSGKLAAAAHAGDARRLITNANAMVQPGGLARDGWLSSDVAVAIDVLSIGVLACHPPGARNLPARRRLLQERVAEEEPKVRSSVAVTTL